MTSQTLQQLHEKAYSLAGYSFGQLATRLQVALPSFQHKGWLGNLIELYLGAHSGSKSQPDFPEFNLELKTLPLYPTGKPKESTFVCTLSLRQVLSETWETSRVYQKLQQVLWVAVEGDIHIPFAERRIIAVQFWQPSVATLTILQTDWEEIVEKIRGGELASITANFGSYLHLRPKAQHGKILCRAWDEEGSVLTLPRGFYLRTQLTQQIFKCVG